MPASEFLSDDEVMRLPPMLFGKIRWGKGIGAPVGNPCSGFKSRSTPRRAGARPTRATCMWSGSACPTCT